MSKEIVKVGVSLHNKFHIEVHDSVTGELVQEGFAENVVLNQALSKLATMHRYLGSGGSFGDGSGSILGGGPLPDTPLKLGGFIHLGSGTTAPDVAQTALTTFVYGAASTWVSSAKAADNLSGNIVQRLVIDAGQRIGDVYREVGLAAAATVTAPNLSTRALIKDGLDAPLTITKADLQVVTITATTFVVISHAYGANLLFIGGAAFNTSANSLISALVANPTVAGQNHYFRTNGGLLAVTKFQIGSDGTAPANTDSNGTQRAVLTKIGADVTATEVLDAANFRVTYSCRIPSTTSGTIREIGFLFPDGAAGALRPLFRLVLPCANYVTNNIVKDATNVVDISFVLQFGSL